MERPPMERALSTDVVLDIVLSHLKVRDLLRCRTVSKVWNKASSAVLRRRSTRIKSSSTAKTLTELGQCLKQNSDFPFAGLKFDQPWKLRTLGAMKFLKNYGTRFTSLYLGTWSDMRLEDIAPLLNHLPRLSMLEVGAYSPTLHAASLNSVPGQEDGTILNLPSLHTVRISGEFNEDILREVFAAASPSLRIECLSATFRVVEALKRIGKLRNVSVMNVVEDKMTGHELRVAELPSSESPTLTELDFNVRGCLSLEGLKTLMISSQDSLKDLRLTGVWSPELLAGCLELTNLTALTLRSKEYSHQYVFQGKHGEKFPALRELTIDITWVSRWSRYTFADKLSDGLFVVPSVTTIDLGTSHVDINQMEGLARSFPNVIEVQLKFRSSHHNLVGLTTLDRDPIDIWSVGEFKCLEKLRIWNYTIETQNYGDMDSFLTGIPVRICENLRRHQQLNLTDSPFNELLRASPSILQFNNLKELTVCVECERGSEELPEEPPFISMVSVWYALSMMPNLEVKFVYDYSWLLRNFKAANRGKAVKKLEAAFKHVQPYIKLEPFFY